MAPSVELLEPTWARNPDQVEAVLALHRRYFSDYSYALREVHENGELPALRDDRVVHQVLATVDRQPAGFVIVHANLRRSIGLIHFVAVDEAFRGVEFGGYRLFELLVDHACRLVEADLATAGSAAWGVAAEVWADTVPRWESVGFTALDIAYREPYFGVRWPEHGEPEFFDMTLVVRPPAGRALDPDAAGRAAASAYLIDHYRLPLDHPEVRWLRQ